MNGLAVYVSTDFASNILDARDNSSKRYFSSEQLEGEPSAFHVRFKAENDAETEWVRRGMPSEQIPRSAGMEVSKHTFFQRPTGNCTSIREYSPVVGLVGNKTHLGAVA